MKVKQQRIVAIVLGAVFVVLTVLYFTVVKPMLTETPVETEPLETVEGEAVGTNNRYLIFPQVERSSIQSVEVHNEFGSYTFYRDASDTFQLKG